MSDLSNLENNTGKTSSTENNKVASGIGVPVTKLNVAAAEFVPGKYTPKSAMPSACSVRFIHFL